MRALLNPFVLLCIIGLFTPLANGQLPQQVTLATTHWCPYACDPKASGSDQLGIVHDYLTTLFKQQGIELHIQFYPWSRAIHLANSGKVDGLLTATQEEAPNLSFTRTATMNYQMCFMTLANLPWHYQQQSDLNHITLGAIQDYAYGEPLDSYIKQAPKQKVSLLKQSSIATLYKMLRNDRFNAFVDDSNVVRWQLKSEFNHLKEAGCLSAYPFYLAFNPARPWSQTLIATLDTLLAEPTSLALREKIRQRYLEAGNRQ